MPEEFNQYNVFFDPEEVHKIPGDDNKINDILLQKTREVTDWVSVISWSKEDFIDAILNSNLPVLEIILLDLQQKLEKIPEINLSDKDASVDAHMRREDLKTYIRRLEEEINLKKTWKITKAPYAYKFDQWNIDLLETDLSLLSNQSPISTLNYFSELEGKIDSLIDPWSDIFKQLYY